MNIQLFIANGQHVSFAQAICDLIEASAAHRGTGIARREATYIASKMRGGQAIIALGGPLGDQLAGFCYIEAWDHDKYVANSGLVVHPDFRRAGLARQIKAAAFGLARDKYPHARVFGITTSAAVMKINTELGYRPVPFSELTQDATFWNGCRSCPNYDILQRNDQQMCLCTGMLSLSKQEEEEALKKPNSPSITKIHIK